MIYVLLTVALSPKNAENHRKADSNSRAGGVGKFLVYYREEKVKKKKKNFVCSRQLAISNTICDDPMGRSLRGTWGRL